MADQMQELELQWKDGHQEHWQEAKLRVEIARKCLSLIREFTSLDSVIDFGCGIGAWLVAAKQLGAQSILGIEGDYIQKSQVLISREEYKIADLSSFSHDYEKRFSMAMTIEVAEHLPEQAAHTFVRNLVDASDYILFSAARPGQTGLGHINEQPLEYWVKKFWSVGYVPIEPIRPYIARDKSVFWWIRQNIIMFVNYDALIRNDKAMKFMRPLGDFSLIYAQERDTVF